MKIRRNTIAVTVVLSASVLATGYAVAAPVCGDVNDSGNVTSIDALIVLREAVGQPVDMLCGPASQPLSTGQTVSYGPGSDGAVGAGVARSFTDNGDGTITDNATGLMWEKKDHSSGIHDLDNLYTWSTDTNLMDGTIVTEFLATLNAGGGFAGYKDWRVPNRFELETLVDLGATNLATYPEFNTACELGCLVATCSCTRPGYYYWSSSTVTLTTYAWGLYTATGSAFSFDKSSQSHNAVRAVRAGSATAAAVAVPRTDGGLVPQPVCGDVNQSGNVTSGDALLVLRGAVGQPVHLLCGPPAQPLTTGQTTTYGPGSDGAVGAGVARSFTDNGDGTITDNATGLMWEKKDNSSGIHDLDNLYTWSTDTNLMNGTIVTEFLATLNAGDGFSGYNDWRVPNQFELGTLVNLGAALDAPTVYAEFDTACEPECTVTTCSCTSMGDVPYWSSTTFTDSATHAWDVYFNSASQFFNAKMSAAHVRAVRAGS